MITPTQVMLANKHFLQTKILKNFKESFIK